MNVLSIDWDYFQDIDKDIVHSFPKGLDKRGVESDIDWKAAYQNDARLFQIKLLQSEYDALFTLLSEQRTDLPFMIAESHADIYRFIYDHTASDDKVILTNIDLHHDLFNNNVHLDCGNWIGKLIQDDMILRKKLRWIANPISLSVYGLDYAEGELNKLMKLWAVSGGINAMKHPEYDLIFLTRSDQWSAPHLDICFKRLSDYVRSRFTRLCFCKNSVRDITQIRRI